MIVTVNPVFDIETGRLLSHEGRYRYDGPVWMFGGSSAASQANEQAQTAFYQQTTAQQAQVFGEQQALLASIQAVEAPILAAGPNQYGFTPGEDAALRAEITSSGAQSESNAENAAQLREKQATGGTPVAPGGAQTAINADIDTLGQQNVANNLTQEKLAGYQQGAANYSQALGALTGNASLLAPTSYTNAAVGAGQGATSSINLVDTENSQLLNSILGGVVGGAANIATGELGTAVSTLGSGQWGW